MRKASIAIALLTLFVSNAKAEQGETTQIGMSCDSVNTPHGFIVKWKESEGKINLNSMCFDLWGNSQASRALYKECLQCAQVQLNTYCKSSRDKTSKYCAAERNFIP